MNERGKVAEWDEFDCPECQANNPWSDGFRVGDEVTCMYCGQPFLVKAAGSEESFRLIKN